MLCGVIVGTRPRNTFTRPSMLRRARDRRCVVEFTLLPGRGGDYPRGSNRSRSPSPVEPARFGESSRLTASSAHPILASRSTQRSRVARTLDDGTPPESSSSDVRRRRDGREVAGHAPSSANSGVPESGPYDEGKREVDPATYVVVSNRDGRIPPANRSPPGAACRSGGLRPSRPAGERDGTALAMLSWSYLPWRLPRCGGSAQETSAWSGIRPSHYRRSPPHSCHRPRRHRCRDRSWIRSRVPTSPWSGSLTFLRIPRFPGRRWIPAGEGTGSNVRAPARA